MIAPGWYRGLLGGLVLWLGWAQAASAQVHEVDKKLQEQINKAIDKGVSYLKSDQKLGGVWLRRELNNDDSSPGATALAGWALLESGVSPKDPVIQKTADYLRRAAITEEKVYHISLMIFFFDKLGEPEDVPLIESLGLRLLQGQSHAHGGWTYTVLAPPLAEQQRLQRLIANRRGGGERPKLPRAFADLAPAIQAQCRALSIPAALPPPGWGLAGDNSNTQFAMIALWLANRYGLPGQKALALVEQRFERSQFADGGWSYDFGKRTHAMTCAGLLGLFVGITSNPKWAGRKDLKELLQKWAPVQRGFQYLAKVMLHPKEAGMPDGRFFYFLWSLERVGMAYDVKFMCDDRGNKVDWYRWGAEWLVVHQGPDGGWHRFEYEVGDCDTSFALLFLKRANVLKPAFSTPDLTVGVTEPKTKPKAKPKEDLPLDLPVVVPKKDSGADKDKKAGGGRSSRLQPRPRGISPPLEFLQYPHMLAAPTGFSQEFFCSLLLAFQELFINRSPRTAIRGLPASSCFQSLEDRAARSGIASSSHTTSSKRSMWLWVSRPASRPNCSRCPSRISVRASAAKSAAS
jgi:hypothetical protein